MSSEELKVYKEHLTKRNEEYKANFAYANGKNPTIIDKQLQKEPDNRIPVPLAKTAVSDMSGYAGRAGDTQIKVLDEGASESEIIEYKKMLVEINEHNKGDLETAELYEEALTQGVAYELFWTSDDLDMRTVTPEYKIVSAQEIFPVYTNALKPTLSKAIRFWCEGKTEYADIYFPLYSEHYIKSEGSEEWTLDVNQGTEGKTEYPYKTVPLAIYPINRFHLSLFDAEKPIIDAHDDLISKSQNEVDRFNALIALFPGKVTKEFVDKLKELRVIDNLGQFDKMPEYLEKNLTGADAFYNQQADRLERLFHKSIKIPDMTAESFAGGAQSGVAIAYKLIGMEFKASQIDTYFDQGLNKRIELINDVLETSFSYVSDINTKVTHKRNLPIDENAKAELALKLKGNISDEAYLRLFPASIIPNVDEELERQDLLPDRILLESYVLAMQAGKIVPDKFMAEALRIDPAEWTKLSMAEKKARIEAMSSDDDDIEEKALEEENKIANGE